MSDTLPLFPPPPFEDIDRGMVPLWFGLPEPSRRFEVVLTAPRSTDETLLPPCVPKLDGLMAVWSASQVTASLTVQAPSASRAVAVAEMVVPDVARAPGCAVSVTELAA